MPAFNDAPPSYIRDQFNKNLAEEAALINFEGEIEDGAAKEEVMKRALEALDWSCVQTAESMFKLVSESSSKSYLRTVKILILLRTLKSPKFKDDYETMAGLLHQTIEGAKELLNSTHDKILTLLKRELVELFEEDMEATADHDQ